MENQILEIHEIRGENITTISIQSIQKPMYTIIKKYYLANKDEYV